MTGSFKVQLINMGTRAAAFQAKLRCLHEYHLRLLHNVLPAPSGVDIANTIKYFCQTLLTVLKDVPNSPHQLIKDPSQDHVRMAAYPNLEYGNLYNALTMLLDVASCIQYGQIIFGKAMLHCFGCLLPFLEKDLIDNLPYLSSSTISVLPSILHQDIVNTLCFYILPFTITRHGPDEHECQASLSVSAVIMMVLQYSNNSAHHCQLLECLMRLKPNVVKDVLCVIAYGTAASRSSAAKLLFYYWPAFNAHLFDRRGLLSKLTNDLVPFVCQREHCPNSGNAEAAKVCFDHNVSITFAPESPPPLYLCIECANEIHREHPNLLFGDILHSMQQVSMVCENKNCRSDEKEAFSICFSTECASYNGNHPIRYCFQCHGNRHNSRRGGDHVVHRSLQPAWQMDPEMQIYLVESVVNLLRAAKPINIEFVRETFRESEGKTVYNSICTDNVTADERQMLGKYGVWLLVGLCSPTPDTPVEVLGRLLSMLFHWFQVTAYSRDGTVMSTIERLKVEHVCPWLKNVCITHYNIFLACLLPHPPEYARVGGHWEALASRTSHLREGLQRLICLVPYEVITSEIWDYVMPHWMEAITNDVPEKELIELKMVLSKMLDADMSPLGFDAKTMYNFVSVRFEKTTSKVQQQALHWLQILTKLEILIPLQQLFSMFGEGVRIMKYGVQLDILREPRSAKIQLKEKEIMQPPRSSISPVIEDDSGNTSAISDDDVPASRHTEFSSDAEHNLSCCILMIDILLKQLELQGIEQHMGIQSTVCESVCRLLKCMVTAARVGLSSHICSLKVSECAYCEASIMWHQLSTKLVQFMAPENPVRPPDPIEEIIEDDKLTKKSPPESEKEKSREREVSLSITPLPIALGPLGGLGGLPCLPDDPGKIIIMAGPMPVAVPQPEPHSVGGVLVHMPHVCSIMTATVETVPEQLDLAAIMPSEKVVTAVARSVTLSDADVATATVQVATPNLVGNKEALHKVEKFQEHTVEDSENGDEFWHTSIGKFKFSLDSLPQTLQYIHQLLIELPTIEKPEIVYYILHCLYILVLHGDALTKAAKDQRGFFIWCQENLIIKNLWDLCDAEHSHICQVCVPLLLHSITLPLGSDAFWRIIQESFNDQNWQKRFQAVERVTVITRFMDSTPLKNEIGLQTALANGFCHLVACMDDINVHVAQRATLYLGTIHDNAVRSLLFCLESQFDLFIVDRPVVLQSLYQLHNSLSDRKIFSWDFFLNRFDTLFVEAQLNLEKIGDITHLKDLRNSENGSEVLLSKINKAREAINQSDSSTTMAKTLSASFGTKWPYKRTMSAPASIIPRKDYKSDKEKVYSRQTSAPTLKRKTSKFGLESQYHFMSGPSDDSNLSANIHRIMDLEGQDKETIHLLIFLLMQFLSRPDQAFPTDEKAASKTQNIVIRHLFLLLGYNQLEKTFHVLPNKLRASAAFNAFTANLPQVLDQNNLVGWFILAPTLQILIYAPDPTGVTLNIGEPIHSTYSYSLWYLEPQTRHNWLLSVLIVLYKYQYIQAPYNNYVNNLIRIVLNSLKGQFHKCKRIPTNTNYDSHVNARSRDASQPSLGSDPDEHVQDSPPSPINILAGGLQPTAIGAIMSKANTSGISKISQQLIRKYQDSHLDADDTAELITIPESDFTDSVVHGSGDTESSSGPFYATNLSEARIVHKNTTPILNHAIVPVADIKPTDCYLQESGHSKAPNIALVDVEVETVMGPKTSMDVKSDDSASHQGKCTLQEGVRMIVTPSVLVSREVREKAVLNPPVDVQRAITVKQEMDKQVPKYNVDLYRLSQTKKPGVFLENDGNLYGQLRSRQGHVADENVTNVNTCKAIKWMQPNSMSILTKALGANKVIVESAVSYGIEHIGVSLCEPQLQQSTIKKESYQNTNNKSKEEKTYESPESPLSKMDVLSLPKRNQNFARDKNISELEIPIPERLLPIGLLEKEGISAFVDRVREVLTIPDISHLKTDSFESLHANARENGKLNDRSQCPRKLIKQTALDTPLNSKDERTKAIEQLLEKNSQNARLHEGQPFVSTRHPHDTELDCAGAWHPITSRKRDSDMDADRTFSNISPSENQPNPTRVSDDRVCHRCEDCGAVKEEYNDEEIGILIIILGTFIHREPSLAAPFLPEILSIVSKFAMHCTFSWQYESSTHLPGGSQSVAHQFIRCVLHELAPNGIFVQLFQTQVTESIRRKYFKSVAQALIDFNELSPTSPIQIVAEALSARKTLPMDLLPIMLRNIAEYMQCIPIEGALGQSLWLPAVQGIETLFRRVLMILPNLQNAESLLDIMVSSLKIPGISKALLDPFSKVLSHCVQNCKLQHKVIYDLCTLSARAYSKDRDKQQLCRQLIFEFIQALKFKTTIPDDNLLLIIGFVLQDAGGALPPRLIEDLPDTSPLCTTNAADCMRQYMNDIIEFLIDFHNLGKMKNFKNAFVRNGLSEDTLGGILKGAMAQYLALEISRCSSRDTKAIARYFPWLYTAPSTLQQGPKEFSECVGHMRLLSWLLLGSLIHSVAIRRKPVPGAQHGPSTRCHVSIGALAISYPIPQEASCHIADHIQVIFAGFAEQSKTSVMHMSSLFHVFTLCQLWSVYLEQIGYSLSPLSDSHNVTTAILFEFWAKVTPCILQLISQSKVLAEMVNLHFISLLEALKETSTTVLGKLLSLWSPVFSSQTQLSGSLHVRLTNCRESQPDVEKQNSCQSESLLKWLLRLQFKMGQIELQSSTAMQFYSI